MEEGDGMVLPWRRLDGKVAMVTGASSGIGYDLCVDLARAGCRIIAAARRMDRLNRLCEEINSSTERGGLAVTAVAVKLDVSDNSAAIEKSVQEAWEAFGRIDALVNNAGLRGSVLSALDLSEEEWNKVFATNTTGLWLVSKHVCKRMLEAEQKGSVINISSIGGLSRGGLPGALAYASSKTAVSSITKMMSMELGRYNIRVNNICPGLFKSEITEELLKKKWLEGVVRKTVPLKEVGKVNPALTSLVRYLIHDSSNYVTGNDFVVDCGAILSGIPIFSSL